MGNCAGCGSWTIKRQRLYDSGVTIPVFESEPGFGHCEFLGFRTPSDFGCNKFEAGTEHVFTERVQGEPWTRWVMTACPDCTEKPGFGCRRCAGTGNVRKYDDGYVGDERTRKHPLEVEGEKAFEIERRRKAAQAILDGLPPPAPPLDPTVLQPVRSNPIGDLI
jgi:hypothetical protein